MFPHSRTALAVAILILAVGATSMAQNIGARAAGMGNAFTAVADDASALYWNPAGLEQVRRPQLSVAVAGDATNIEVTKEAKDITDTLRRDAGPLSLSDLNLLVGKFGDLSGNPLTANVGTIGATAAKDVAVGPSGSRAPASRGRSTTPASSA